MIKLALIALLFFQPDGSPQTPFGFGAALAHAHAAGARFSVTGVFCGQKLVDDAANTTGNYFYGNAICVNSGAGPRWYWFNWPADPDVSVKIARWTARVVVITLQVADPDCLLALSAVEGSPASVSNVSGSGVYRGTATLTATLTAGGFPLVGKSLSFTLNGTDVGTAVTDVNGVATHTNVSLSGVNAGAYAGAVGATFQGEGTNLGNSGTGVLTVSRAEQTITFPSPADRTFGDPDFVVSATASSGLSVNFSATGNCTVNGVMVHIAGAGSCTVTASQAGDSNYAAAANVSRSFQVAKATTSVALASSATPLPHGQSVTFTAAVTSAAGTPSGSVQFKTDGANLGPPQALNAVGVASISTAGLPAGAHVVTAAYGGDANFNPSGGTLAGGQVIGGLFEFAQALFTVNEHDGSVLVTVRRGGDASQAAAVEYATDDGSTPSVPVPCSSKTGIALERCDYTRAQGLLRFAPGETEKSFSMLVNGDSYLEGTETTHVRLSNPTAGTVLGEMPSAAIEIADDTQQASNPLDGSEFFVRQHYHDFLNREPDAPGLAFWTREIEQCGADLGCREVKRINVSAAFFLSIEFQQTGYLAYRARKAAFGNLPGLPVPVTREQMLQDMQSVGGGVIVGADNWEQKLEQNKQAYFKQLTTSATFAALYPPSMSPEQFVDALNQNAGGALSSAEREALVTDLKGNAKSRADIVRAVAEDTDFHGAEFTRAFVLMQYFGYLRRDPDAAPDKDFSGYNFWLGKLNEFGGNFINAEMVKAFLNADEYRNRFGQ